MSLILSGTDGLSDVDGTAATPAIRGTDANTGIFFPAADTIAFAEGGAEAMRLDSSGNLGIGTSSPVTKLHVFGLGVNARVENSGATNSTQFQVKNTVGAVTLGLDSSTGGGFGVANAAVLWYDAAQPLVFATSNTERARITSGGYFKASNNGTYYGSSVSYHELRNTTTNTRTVVISHTDSTNPLGIYVEYTAAAPNGTGNAFLECQDTGASRFVARSNGGLANYSANNVNLSDRREKTNFAPANSYLDKICAIPVQTFNYIDQNLEEDGGLTLGVVAQDVQAVAPEMVMESNWGTEEEPKMRLSIYQTDLQYALMKCIQEQQALIVSMREEIDALKIKVGA